MDCMAIDGKNLGPAKLGLHLFLGESATLPPSALPGKLLLGLLDVLEEVLLASHCSCVLSMMGLRLTGNMQCGYAPSSSHTLREYQGGGLAQPLRASTARECRSGHGTSRWA